MPGAASDPLGWTHERRRRWIARRVASRGGWWATAESLWRRRFHAIVSGFPSWGSGNPDRLIYTSNRDGKPEVYAWDRQSRMRRRVTDREHGTGTRVPSRVDPQGEEVWWFDDRAGDELGRWMITPFRGGRSRVATPLAPSYSMGLAVGVHVSVIGVAGARGTHVHVVPRATDAAPRCVYSSPGAAYLSPLASSALSSDGTLIALAHSERGDSRNPSLRVIDVAGRTVLDLWDGPARGLWPGSWSPVADDHRLLVQHERGPTTRPMIVSVGGQVVPFNLEDLPGAVWGRDWYPDAESVLVLHEYETRTELFRWWPASSRLERITTAPGTIEHARVRPDGDVWYYVNASPTPPHTRSSAGPLLPAGGRATRRSVAYREARVGPVHVFCAEPRTRRPHPMLALLHGGPETHDRDSWSPTVQAWVDHGVAVVLVNYRGSSGYGKAWSDAIKGAPGLTELEDVARVQDWAIADGLAHPRRCIIGGTSWGGYLTLLALGTQPERWALGLAHAPIGDLVATYEDEMHELRWYDESLFGGSPHDLPERYRERNPITFAERIQAPLLVMFGTRDPRCPARGITGYLARLRELGKPHETYEYDGGHSAVSTAEQIRQLELQLRFVARHLGTTPPQP